MHVVDIPPSVKDGDYFVVVSTGNTNKQTASAPISLGGTMTVACIDWFRSGPPGIPGKRACDPGFYTAEILSVAPPPGTNMVWDGVTPENGIILDPKPQ